MLAEGALLTRLAIVHEIIDAFEKHLGGEHPAYQFRGVLARIKHREETGGAPAADEAPEITSPGAGDGAATVEAKTEADPAKVEPPTTAGAEDAAAKTPAKKAPKK